MIISDDGIIIRISLKDVGTYSRNTQGVKLINLNEGSKVAAVAVIQPSDEEELEEEENSSEETVNNDSSETEEVVEELTEEVEE